MNHIADGKKYNVLADKADKLLNVKGHMSKWDLDQFINCDTLRAFDIEIINKLTSILLEDVGEFDKYRDIINKKDKPLV